IQKRVIDGRDRPTRDAVERVHAQLQQRVDDNVGDALVLRHSRKRSGPDRLDRPKRNGHGASPFVEGQPSVLPPQVFKNGLTYLDRKTGRRQSAWSLKALGRQATLVWKRALRMGPPSRRSDILPGRSCSA